MVKVDGATTRGRRAPGNCSSQAWTALLAKAGAGEIELGEMREIAGLLQVRPRAGDLDE